MPSHEINLQTITPRVKAARLRIRMSETGEESSAELPLAVRKLRFGDYDARSEFFHQAREGSLVSVNSFRTPPGVDLKRLLSGSNFFIHGSKGSGKTALIWFLKDKHERGGGRAEVVLFKSNLTESERQRIISSVDTSVFTGQREVEVQYDYKQSWLWFIIRSLARMIKDEDVISGRDIVHDLKRLTGTGSEGHQSIFSGLQLTKIKSNIEAGLKAGPFRSSMKTEIEVSKKQSQDDILEIVNIAERFLCEVKLYSNRSCKLFFDELELFLHEKDQHNRDLALIRDLLYAVKRINHAVGLANPSFYVYASVRSEVLEELNRIGPELRRDVSDYGARVAWDVKSDAPVQPILDIVDARIEFSEVEAAGEYSADGWKTYFPARVQGKLIRAYLLDISMNRPRNLLQRISLSQSKAGERTVLLAEDFSESDTQFSGNVWSEVEEDLLTTYTKEEVAGIKATFIGFRVRFEVQDLINRVDKLLVYHERLRSRVAGKVGVLNLLKALYRIGAVGNQFGTDQDRSANRDRWVFRGFSEPALDKKFVIHASLRKVFQL